MAVPVTKHRFTVHDYEQMVEAGILTSDDRVELIDGEVFAMTPMGVPHAAVLSRLHHFLMRIADRAVFRVQMPVVLGDHDEPEPDLVIAEARDDFYASRHPGPSDIHLAVEVAESSVRFDREIKGPLYSRSGIREYWLVDLASDAIEVYRDPRPDGYAMKTVVTRGGQVAPAAFPEVSLAVDDILG